MREKKEYFTHSVCLTALFILGEVVIFLPTKNADNYTLLALLISVFMAFIIYFLSFFISKKTLSLKNDNLFKKIIIILFYLSASVYALFLSAKSFKVFTVFAKRIMMPNIPSFFSVILFLGVVLFFLRSSRQDILKFFLLAFFIVSAVLLFFLIANLGKLLPENLVIEQMPDFNTVFSQVKPYFFSCSLPICILPIYDLYKFKESTSLRGFFGLIVGFSMLVVCVFGNVLVFGSDLAGRLEYPYSSFVSIVSVGRLFSRLDGFSYLLYFICTLGKITVCLFVVETGLKSIYKILNDKK